MKAKVLLHYPMQVILLSLFVCLLPKLDEGCSRQFIYVLYVKQSWYNRNIVESGINHQ